MDGNLHSSGVPQNFPYPPQDPQNSASLQAGYQVPIGIAASRLYPSVETNQPGASSSRTGDIGGARAGFMGSAGNIPQAFMQQHPNTVPYASFQGPPHGVTRSSSPPTSIGSGSGTGGAGMSEERLHLLRQLRLQQQQQQYHQQMQYHQQQQYHQQLAAQQQMYSQPGILAPGMLMLQPSNKLAGGAAVGQQQQLPPLSSASVHLQQMMGRPPAPGPPQQQQLHGNTIGAGGLGMAGTAAGSSSGGGVVRSSSPSGGAQGTGSAGSPLVAKVQSAQAQMRQQQFNQLQGQQQQMLLQEEEESKKSRGNYLCSKCKVPKKGHVCPFQTRLIRRDQSKSEVSDAACQAELDEGMTLRALTLMMQMGGSHDVIIQGSKASYSPETYLQNPCFVLPPEATEGGDEEEHRRKDQMLMLQIQEEQHQHEQLERTYEVADRQGFTAAADKHRFGDGQQGAPTAVAVAVGPAQVAFFPAAPSAKGASTV